MTSTHAAQRLQALMDARYALVGDHPSRCGRCRHARDGMKDPELRHCSEFTVTVRVWGRCKKFSAGRAA